MNEEERNGFLVDVHDSTSLERERLDLIVKADIAFTLNEVVEVLRDISDKMEGGSD